MTPIKLITPHGDWEHGELADLLEDLEASLPLMGIGNFPHGHVFMR